MWETYRPTTLKTNACRLHKASPSNRTPAEFSTSEGEKALFRQAMVRPSKILLFFFIALFLSFYSAVGCSLFYIILTTINSVYEKGYGFSQGSMGLIYLAGGTRMFPYNLLVIVSSKNHLNKILEEVK